MTFENLLKGKSYIFLIYALVVYLLFDHFKIFNAFKKNFNNLDPLMIKIVLVILGTYTLDILLRRYVIEGFTLNNMIIGLFLKQKNDKKI